MKERKNWEISKLEVECVISLIQFLISLIQFLISLNRERDLDSIVRVYCFIVQVKSWVTELTKQLSGSPPPPKFENHWWRPTSDRRFLHMSLVLILLCQPRSASSRHTRSSPSRFCSYSVRLPCSVRRTESVNPARFSIHTYNGNAACYQWRPVNMAAGTGGQRPVLSPCLPPPQNFDTVRPL